MKAKGDHSDACLNTHDETMAYLNTSACYQCKRCTNGCPLFFAMDIYPDEVIRRVNLGHMDRVLTCHTIWLCSACETCTTRCPNEVDIAGVMDYLKEKAIRCGVSPPQKSTYAFHESFMKEIEKRGRIFEAGLMQRYMLRSGELFRKIVNGSIMEDVTLGLKMLRKGRMPIRPESIKGRKEVRRMMRKEH